MKKFTPPSVKLEKYKRTKMIATVGPSTNDYDSILAMAEHGVNGFRLNFSHGDHKERAKQIEWIRKASEELGKPVAIIGDLQGPKIRLGDFDGEIQLRAGQDVRLGYQTDYVRDKVIPTQYDLSKKAERGQRILLVDGKIKGTITSVQKGMLFVQIENDGILTKRKGINLPDTDFAGDIITEKDKEDLAFICSNDVDYIGMSFVQTADDIREMQKMIKNHGSNVKVIAKIETLAAVDNINEIIDTVDAVMVARGDLAIETEPESVPVITRKIISLCQQHNTISIVATQMLMSMTETPEPTRAEASDVATAVVVGSDCVMLSDETANGKYPMQSVAMMKRIILYTQENMTSEPDMYRSEDESIQGAISSAIITLAHQVKARVIVAATKSGATALNIAAHRPTMPIVVVASVERVANQCVLIYGSIVFVRPESTSGNLKMTAWLHENKVLEQGDVIVAASGVRPGQTGGTDTIKVRTIGTETA